MLRYSFSVILLSRDDGLVKVNYQFRIIAYVGQQIDEMIEKIRDGD